MRRPAVAFLPLGKQRIVIDIDLYTNVIPYTSQVWGSRKLHEFYKLSVFKSVSVGGSRYVCVVKSV